MKTTANIFASACLTSLAFSAQTVAEHHGEAPGFQPVELFSCTYNKGKGARDLDKVIVKFRKWADKNDPGYSAWTLTPAFTSADITFDVAWLGAWPDYASQGAANDNWPANGMQADFDKVLTCDSHSLVHSTNIAPPANDTPPASAVILFSSCTNAEGSDGDGNIAAHKKMSAYMKSQGSTAGAWIFYPGMGSGDTDFDYYFIRAYDSFARLAHDDNVIANGGGYMKARGIFKGVVSCDHPRAYSATLVRAGS